MKYTFDYEYDEKYAHRLIHAGNLYYQYDVNGNVICEQDGSFESNGDGTSYCKITEEAENVYSSAYGWGLWREEVGGKSNGRYRRTYSWNERNQLVCSQDSRYTTTYDENRRWLDTIKTTSATDQILQNMTYNFDKVGNVRGYENIGENYKTAQNYKYDSLYQLVGVKGQTEYKPRWPEDHEDHHKYVSTYEQSFRFDNIGNMKSKYSEKLDKPHNQHTSSDLNYSFEYKYDPEYAHRTLSADNMYYSYDENGNIINERIDREATKEELEHDIAVADEVYSLDYGIALPNQPSVETKAYSRTYVWNERNLLRTSVENGLVVQYRYGEDGQRAVKSSSLGETLYFNNMWQMSTTPMGMRQTKHIFVGETRIATKNNWWQDTGTEYEKYNTYWYHADHLGSAQLVSNWKGEEYERIEYTPYGEIWVEKVKNGHESINYRFTGKEMDSETGLYYFGARYLDPKYSRWLSCDPALRDYVSQTSKGEGGIYNHINMHLYHYGGNNPIRFVDPTGLYDEENGYTEDEISAFNNMSTSAQLEFLKNEKASVSEGTDSAGKKSMYMRNQLKNSMKLSSLFYGRDGDEKFMNEDLRDFLNLNDNGSNSYTIDEMKSENGWSELGWPGNLEHQHEKNGGTNQKFINKDGREAIFDAKGKFVTNELDKGTFNYSVPSGLSKITAWAPGYPHGKFDMKPFYRQHGMSGPWYWRINVGKNYGFNSK